MIQTDEMIDSQTRTCDVVLTHGIHEWDGNIVWVTFMVKSERRYIRDELSGNPDTLGCRVCRKVERAPTFACKSPGSGDFGVFDASHRFACHIWSFIGTVLV